MGQIDSAGAAYDALSQIPDSTSLARFQAVPNREWFVRAGVPLLVILAGVLTYTLSAVKIAGGPDLAFSDANNELVLAGKGWVATLGWFGALLTIIGLLHEFAPQRDR